MSHKKLTAIHKEKEKEKKLNLIKITEISRLMRYRQLRPIADERTVEEED